MLSKMERVIHVLLVCAIGRVAMALGAVMARRRSSGLVGLLVAAAYLGVLPVVSGLPQAAADDLDNAVFNMLVNDLDSPVFATRLNATNQLTAYVNPASATQLTTAQLQSLCNVAKTGALEPSRRAGGVLREWVKLNPNTFGPARTLLDGIQVKQGKFDATVAPPEGDFMLGPFKIAYGGPGIKLQLDLQKLFLEAQQELGGGFTDNVVPALKAMKKVVDDLTDNDLMNLYFSKNGMEVKKADLSKALDDAVKAGTDLLQKINASIGDPAPGPAKKVDVPGMGAIDTGQTFRLTLNGPGLTARGPHVRPAAAGACNRLATGRDAVLRARVRPVGRGWSSPRPEIGGHGRHRVWRSVAPRAP